MTPAKPHGDLDNAHLATAMRANREMRELVAKANRDAGSTVSRSVLLEMALVIDRQNEALHQMNLIRQTHSRRLKR